jgi:NADH:ubiquinone oxidoreductase subunit F (NADH-binding)
MNFQPTDIEKVTKWTRIILPDVGNLHKIENYLAHGGYKALRKALEMKSENIIDEVKK